MTIYDFMLKLQPDLSGNPFVRRNDEQKIGVEGGLSCPNNYKFMYIRFY
ncbi:hypothetical protein [Chryseobacterium sp.]